MLREEADKRILDWAMIIHLSALVGVFGGPIPFGNILAPVVLWILKGKEHPYIDEQGREAINFQINMMLYYIAAFFLLIFGIGIPIFIGLSIMNVVFIIKAAIKVRDGYHYKYPTLIRFM
ncbi:MAG: orotate phosphoribosyltransferase [Candidatus Hydrogenedentota bacterium]|nr:MAG: orotate phosphoribosyltransferase [Candidatus Hydrogenedentota bacterium]